MTAPSASLRTVLATWAAPIASGTSVTGLGVTAILTHSKAGLIAAGLLAAITAITAALPRVFEAIYQRRPEIIQARGRARAAEITARAEAEARRISAGSEARALQARTEARTQILRQGTNPACTTASAAMLRQQAIDPDLPQGRRLSDDALARLLRPPPQPGTQAPRRSPAHSPRPPSRHLKLIDPPGRDVEELRTARTEATPARPRRTSTAHPAQEHDRGQRPREPP